jgi:hypothetical protein
MHMEQQNAPHINLYDQGPVGPNAPTHAPGAGHVSLEPIAYVRFDDGEYMCPSCAVRAMRRGARPTFTYTEAEAKAMWGDNAYVTGVPCMHCGVELVAR